MKRKINFYVPTITLTTITTILYIIIACFKFDEYFLTIYNTLLVIGMSILTIIINNKKGKEAAYICITIFIVVCVIVNLIIALFALKNVTFTYSMKALYLFYYLALILTYALTFLTNHFIKD